MAFEGSQPVQLQGAVAGADLSAATTQYKFVKYNGTDNQVVLCAATTDIPCGVLQSPAPSAAVGTPVQVLAVGVTKLQQSGAQLASGYLIGTDAAAQAVRYTPGSSHTNYVVGQVMGVFGAGTTAAGYVTAAINCVAPVYLA